MAKTTVSAGYIAANAITATELAANSVTAASIASGAILSIDIGANSVSSTAIAANAVNSSEVASNAISTAQIASNAVTAASIATNAVGADQISPNAVKASELASDALSGQNFTGDVTFDTTTLVVDSTNNRVGIGTASPNAYLEVDDGGTVGQILLTRSGSTRVELSTNANEGEISLYRSNNAKNVYISSYYNSYFNGGKVGIGNTSPLGKLTISNAAGANAPTTISAANTYLQLGSDDYGPSNNGKFMIGFGYTDATNTNSPAYIGFEEASAAGDTYGDLTFYTRTVTTDTAPTERMRITGGGVVKIWHGGTTYYTSFEEANEINTYTAAGASSTMYLNHNGGDINLRSGSMEVKDNGDIVIGNTVINPASGFSTQRGIGYDNSTGFTEIAATSVGAVLELGTNNASGSEILTLRKQGTVIGGISTFDGEPHFGRSTAGIMPIGSASVPRVVPTNFSAGTLANNTVDLGYDDARWKDFYMAGDMNVGSQTTNIVPANRKAWFQGGGSYFTSYTAGQSTITSDASGLIVGTPSTRSGTANHYSAGISFDHLLNYSATGNVTYNTYPHAWIGLKFYDFPGHERSSLVFATRNDTTGAGPTAERLVISPSGEVTMPSQPAFCATLSPGQSITTSDTKIGFQNEIFDRAGNHSSGTFTAPVAGVYSFGANFLVYPWTAGIINVRWFKNGSGATPVVQSGYSAGSHSGIHTTTLLSLASGDTVELYISGSSLNAGVTVYGGQAYWHGHLVG